MNQPTIFSAKKRWEEILYDLIDYPSIQFIYKNFDENFIVQLSFLDENIIQEILSDNK